MSEEKSLKRTLSIKRFGKKKEEDGSDKTEEKPSLKRTLSKKFGKKEELLEEPVVKEEKPSLKRTLSVKFGKKDELGKSVDEKPKLGRTISQRFQKKREDQESTSSPTGKRKLKLEFRVVVERLSKVPINNTTVFMSWKRPNLAGDTKRVVVTDHAAEMNDSFRFEAILSVGSDGVCKSSPLLLELKEDKLVKKAGKAKWNCLGKGSFDLAFYTKADNECVIIPLTKKKANTQLELRVSCDWKTFDGQKFVKVEEGSQQVKGEVEEKSKKKVELIGRNKYVIESDSDISDVEYTEEEIDLNLSEMTDDDDDDNFESSFANRSNPFDTSPSSSLGSILGKLAGGTLEEDMKEKKEEEEEEKRDGKDEEDKKEGEKELLVEPITNPFDEDYEIVQFEEKEEERKEEERKEEKDKGMEKKEEGRDKEEKNREEDQKAEEERRKKEEAERVRKTEEARRRKEEEQKRIQEKREKAEEEERKRKEEQMKKEKEEEEEEKKRMEREMETERLEMEKMRDESSFDDLNSVIEEQRRELYRLRDNERKFSNTLRMMEKNVLAAESKSAALEREMKRYQMLLNDEDNNEDELTSQILELENELKIEHRKNAMFASLEKNVYLSNNAFNRNSESVSALRIFDDFIKMRLFDATLPNSASLLETLFHAITMKCQISDTDTIVYWIVTATQLLALLRNAKKKLKNNEAFEEDSEHPLQAFDRALSHLVSTLFSRLHTQTLREIEQLLVEALGSPFEANDYFKPEKLSINRVIAVLSERLQQLRKSFWSDEMIRIFFKLCLDLINRFLSNKIIQSSQFCTFNNGIRIKMEINILSAWLSEDPILSSMTDRLITINECAQLLTMSKNRNFVDLSSFESLNVRQIREILRLYKSTENKQKSDKKGKDEGGVKFATVPKGMGKTSREIVEKMEKERGISAVEQDVEDDIVDEKLLRKLEEANEGKQNLSLLVADSLSITLEELEKYIQRF